MRVRRGPPVVPNPTGGPGLIGEIGKLREGFGMATVDCYAFGLVPVQVIEADDRLVFCNILDRTTHEPVKNPERVYRWEDLKDPSDEMYRQYYENSWIGRLGRKR